MTHHLDNLLVSSRALTDSVHIALGSVDLRAEAERVVASMAPETTVSVLGGDQYVEADAVRVRHILRNLLLNAQQHGGAEIIVHVSADEEGTWVEVVDDGPGVSPDQIDSAFEAFRAAGPRTEIPDTAGLGLHVARLLARMMGAEVTYRRHGALSVFRLQFPA